MKDIMINSQTRLNSLGRERFYQGNSPTAVLLMHGFTGTPDEMDYLGKKINEVTGFTVYIPRLPGHGTSRYDFMESNARDWLRKTYDSYLQLKYDHQQVYLVGLSMGGLLSLLTAARFHVDKLVLISAALYTSHPFLPFARFLKPFLPEIKKKGPFKQEFTSAAEKDLHHNYHRQYFTAQVAELHKLMVLARKSLKRINSATLIISSEKDQQVPLKAARELKAKIAARSKTIKIYKDSPHVINNGPEKESCAREIISFLLK